ncbi:hypothetical protein [Sphingomicrobium aestuariivivum]|uniref:hypothetical protein n=1 Tax=Sphingomicrobium aestuariivivum TaxID=1582356 RepID=UPI001FD696C0|nr:hypothetical protein [Sphingomicrobium aestuariivivum]MCJ8191705.1 hypothetical protein [Sphingomicrobium aestuariivivum]
MRTITTMVIATGLAAMTASQALAQPARSGASIPAYKVPTERPPVTFPKPTGFPRYVTHDIRMKKACSDEAIAELAAEERERQRAACARWAEAKKRD